MMAFGERSGFAQKIEVLALGLLAAVLLTLAQLEGQGGNASAATSAQPPAPSAPLPMGEVAPGLGGDALLEKIRASVREHCSSPVIPKGRAQLVVYVAPNGRVRDVIVEPAVQKPHRECLGAAASRVVFPEGEEHLSAKVTVEW